MKGCHDFKLLNIEFNVMSQGVVVLWWYPCMRRQRKKPHSTSASIILCMPWRPPAASTIQYACRRLAAKPLRLPFPGSCPPHATCPLGETSVVGDDADPDATLVCRVHHGRACRADLRDHQNRRYEGAESSMVGHAVNSKKKFR